MPCTFWLHPLSQEELAEPIEDARFDGRLLGQGTEAGFMASC